MQIKVAITKISVFAYTDKSNGARLMKMISIPMFSWSMNHMRPIVGSCDDYIIMNSIWLPWYAREN